MEQGPFRHTYTLAGSFFLAVALFLCGLKESSAQQAPVVSDTLHVVGPGPFQLRPFVVEGSLRLETVFPPRSIASSSYTLNAAAGLLVLGGVPADSSMSLVATYAYVPLDRPVGVRAWKVADETPNAAATPIIQTRAPNLRRSGSVSRGVVAGSGRDAAIESALRFEMEGELTPGVRVMASLTDEDTPVLPQGTTRRLDQFDRVFIRLSTDRGNLQLGDVDIEHEMGTYGRVRRSLQGALVEFTAAPDEALRSQGLPWQTRVAGATSRGVFRSQQIQAIDGVQGPYRLEGNTGERFILVLPGSERVFLDGELMTRGAQEDYTIDYTTAEISFTSKHIMGRERRIQVEFEFTTNQFTRTFLFGAGRGRMRYADIQVTAIREADGNAFTEELAFSAEDSAAVIGAGDDTPFRSGAREVTYDPEALFTQYFEEQRRLPGGDTVTIFVPVIREPLPGEQVFRVTFTRFGVRQGSYTRTGAGRANGIVFEYAGEGQGAYEPVVPISAPRSQELFSLRLESRRLPFARLSAEWAGSRLDRNQLSERDGNDDRGAAWSATLATNRWVSENLPIWMEADGQFERRSSYFTSFDRTRDVEFERTWNIPRLESASITENAVPGQEEAKGVGRLTVGVADSSYVSAIYERVELGDAFDGRRQRLSVQSFEPGRPSLDAYATWTTTRDRFTAPSVLQEGFWRRHSARMAAPNGRSIRPWVRWQSEQMTARQGERATISVEPDFTLYGAGVEGGRRRLNGFASLEIRDETRFQRHLKPAQQGSTATNVDILTTRFGARASRSRMDTDISVGWRQTRQDGDTRDDALLINASSQIRPSRRTRVDVLYDARSERSATLQEIFIRTGPERGQFVWVDTNDDDVIQLDEFIPETNPTEGDYVRTLLPSDSLEAVTSVTSRVRLDLRPDRGRRFRGVGATTVLEIQETSRTPSRKDVYLMKLGSFRNPGETVRGRFRLAQTVSLLPWVRLVDVDLSAQTVRSLNSLASGSEALRTDLMEIDASWRPLAQWTWGLGLAHGLERSESAQFATRSFDVVSWGLRPSGRLSVSRRWTVAAEPAVSFKTERRSNTEATVWILPIQSVWALESRFRLTTRLEHARVTFHAGSSPRSDAGLVGFQLTEGRGRGASWLWRTGLQAELSDKLSARLTYDGRSPSSGRTIHTGRFQLTAFF